MQLQIVLCKMASNVPTIVWAQKIVWVHVNSIDLYINGKHLVQLLFLIVLS